MKKLINFIFIISILFFAYPAKAQYAYPNNYYGCNNISTNSKGGFLNFLKGVILPYATYSFYGSQYYPGAAYGYQNQNFYGTQYYPGTGYAYQNQNVYGANQYASSQQAYISAFSSVPYQGNVPNIAPGEGVGFDSSPNQNPDDSNTGNAGY